MNRLTGVLLVNLGTPASPHPKDVYRYLVEFLTDYRVIDFPWLYRQFLVRGVITPSRYKQSAKAYEQIWTPEGSPLLVYGKRVEKSLQQALGDTFHVSLAMRYGAPSLENSIKQQFDHGASHLIILPLFPQYSSSTTGSIHQKIMQLVQNHTVFPKITFIDHYFKHPALIDAFCAVAKKYVLEKYDHLLFSFHGLPQRQLLKADRHQCCLQTPQCCQTITSKNQTCYAAQCYACAKEIAHQMNIPPEKYSVCFQSILGKDPWMQPYTNHTIAHCAQKGHKKLLLFCPSFVCDCLETLFEIKIEYAAEFIQAGGECLDLVEGLNDHPQWIRALQKIVLENSN